MATNVKKLRSFIKEQKEEAAKKEERKNRPSINFYQNKVGKNCLFLCPPHENMDEIPFVLRGKHRNCGPEGKTDFMCLSVDGKKLAQCPQCKEVKALYDTKKEKDKKQASKMRRNQRYYWSIIDMAPILDLDKNDKVEIPECLLDFPGEDEKKIYKSRGCKACDWEESCENGVRAWSVGKKIQEPCLDEIDDLDDEEDVTNPKAGRPIVVRRKGEEAMNTEYSGIKFDRKVRLPKEVIARMYEQLIDLSAVSIPKDAEQVNKLMTGDTEEADDTDVDETPECFGKYDDDEKECLKCDFCDPCEVETGGDSKKGKDPDPDPDDDDEPVKEEIDPDLDGEGDEDEDEDELEKKLRERALARAGERKAQKRTPAPKGD